MAAINMESGGVKASKKEKKCGFKFDKNDFLPEESFKSWGNYMKALGETKQRFKDRVVTRSMDHLELEQVRTQSQHEMKKTLNWLDLLWFGIGGIMGAGIFVLTGEAARNLAGPAVVVSYFVSGISALLCVFCYTEFGIELPVAGGSFAYLRVELGDFIAYIAAGNILLQYIVSSASVARSWTSYFATLFNSHPDQLRFTVSFLPDKFNHLDPIAVGISFLICSGACWSMKGSSRFNSFASALKILIIVFILIAGFTKANPANYSNFAPFDARGILKATAMLFFAYVGFDGVSTLGEEVKNPGRDIPIGLIGSMLVTIIVYCLMSAALCLMQPFYQINADAPYTIAFQSVGMNWAKYIVAIGALQGMTTVLLALIISQARYFTHIGRSHMAPPILAVVNEKTGTPVNATVIMTVVNSLVALFTSLDVLANLLSITTLLVFSLVALALLVRRYYVSGDTSDHDRNKLVGFLSLIILSSIGSAVYSAISAKGWVGYIVTALVWFSATLGLQVTVKQARKPKVWGVPLLPWLPSACIAMNVFIMGSIDGESYLRFLVWTLMLLVYYLLVALHASYDAAKEVEKENNAAPDIEEPN